MSSSDPLKEALQKELNNAAHQVDLARSNLFLQKREFARNQARLDYLLQRASDRKSQFLDEYEEIVASIKRNDARTIRLLQRTIQKGVMEVEAIKLEQIEHLIQQEELESEKHE